MPNRREADIAGLVAPGTFQSMLHTLFFAQVPYRIEYVPSGTSMDSRICEFWRKEIQKIGFQKHIMVTLAGTEINFILTQSAQTHIAKAMGEHAMEDLKSGAGRDEIQRTILTAKALAALADAAEPAPQSNS